MATHPRHVDENDPSLVRLRDLALAYPGAQEKWVVGWPAFYTRKVFAYFGGSTRDEYKAGAHPPRVSVLLDEDERLAMLANGAVVPAYIGPFGWIGVDLEGADWALIAELIDASYRNTALKKLVKALDARSL